MVLPAEMPALARIGADCIDIIAGDIADLKVGEKLPEKFLAADPVKVEPWKKLIAENTPGRLPAGIPVFISQGTGDTVVDPPVTANYVAELCKGGTPVRFAEYPKVTHGAIAEDSAAEAVAWMRARFAGEAPPNNCR